jgi:mono/diheme cytochrome c family protein
LKAKPNHAIDANGMAVTCAEIARRWLAAGDLPLTGAALAEKLTATDGPLDLIGSESIDRIETNLQIAHAPKSAVRDFRTDYLLKVFHYNPQSQTFEEAPLENQIDRERILADENLKRDFKTWLLDPRHFSELDRGTILIPDKFLATGAIAATPVGFAPSNLQPAFGLVQGEGAAADPVFRESDVVAALKKAAARGDSLQNIRSVAGFEHRLNDVTCAGCHQTRGIGGFHFPGVDWMTAKPDNSTVVPASPHFFGDQIRRRDILTSFRDGKRPDYSRGFSSRPQVRGSTELAGTEYEDGWGAHCYLQHPGDGDNDRSFKSWTCAEGLACQVAGQTTRMGMCFVK